MLSEHRVPNVDRLVRKSWVQDGPLRLVFEPRGDRREPNSPGELFQALICVLETLVALHKAGWMHRGIRWPNVVRTRGKSSSNRWFLIDFGDAAKCPQQFPSGDNLRPESHAPEIFDEECAQTTAVDMWSVGHLNKSSKHWPDLREDQEIETLVLSLSASDPAQRPTAPQALCAVESLSRSFEES